jgi:hypothetical protein
MSHRPAESVRHDERELALPDGWLRRRHPRRGGSPVPQPAVDGSAAGEIAALLRSADTRGAIEEALRSPDSEPDAVEAVRRHLSGDGSPLGAAAIASVLIKQQGPGFEEVIGRFADSWVTEYGLTFAACAFTELAHVALAGHRYHRPHRVDHKAISYLRPEDMVFILWRARDVPRKLRALLADAADDAYEDAVKHLDDHRRAPMHKAMASYLIPTRHDWVEECIAVLPGAQVDYSGWLPWCSVGSPGHAALLAGQMPFGYSEAEIDILTTVMEGVGTEIAPLLAAVLDESPYLSADSRKLILQSLAMLPTNEAFLTLVGRLDKPYVEAAVSGAAKRFPVRALRLLAPASRGKSRISTAATELLRAHVPAHAELVARELPGLPAEIHGTVESIVVSTARVAGSQISWTMPTPG